VPENDNADRVASAAEQAEKRTEETRGFMRSVSRATRRKYSPEEKIRIVLEGFHREAPVSTCAGVKGSTPPTTTRGPGSSWRLGRRD
jgi:hypothetical protein